jgi:hypothetical protein
VTGPAYIPERRISPRARRILAERRMAEANWYRPSGWDNVRNLIGCAAQAAGALIASLLIWWLLFALFMGGAA